MKAAEEMKREELIAYDKWLTRRKWGTGEIISPEKAADLYLAEHPLHPAEGAEKPNAKKYLADNGYGSGTNYTTNQVAYLMTEFAALNAQRLAEKMVEEKKCYYCNGDGQVVQDYEHGEIGKCTICNGTGKIRK